MNTDRLDNGRMILNYDNISYIRFVENVDRHELYFPFKIKLKTEEVKISREFATRQEMERSFATKGFFILNDYLINAKAVALTQEGKLNDETKILDLTLHFNNSTLLELKVSRDAWTSFKNHRLV